MPESAQPEAQPKSRRRHGGWRLLGRAALAAAALLLAFHQPILRAVLWHEVVRLAASKQVQLSGELKGSVWTHLTLQDVRAVSLGRVPFDTIEIDRLRLEYSLWTLIRRGPAHALTYYNLRNARLGLAPVRGNTDEDKKLARLLRNILQQPAMYSDRAQIENFNMTVRTNHGLYVWEDIHALLDPDKPGYIRIGKLDLPGYGCWTHLRAPATYVDRHLVLRNFDIGQDVHGVRMEFDASRRDQGVGSFSFEGTVLGGDLGLFIWGRNLPGGEREAQVNAYLANLPLQTLARYFGWKVPLEGPVREAWVSMSGDPRTPALWKGELALSTEHAKLGGYTLDEASVRLSLDEGRVHLREIRAATGANQLSFHGEYQLPAKLNEFRPEGLEAVFDLAATDLPRLNPAFTSGTLTAHGAVHLKEGGLAVDGTAKAAGVKGAEVGVKGASADFSATRPVVMGERGKRRPWYEGLAGSVRLDAGEVYFRQFFARRVAFDLPFGESVARLRNGVLDLNGRDILTGEGWVGMDDPYAYEASLRGNVADLSIFQPFFKKPVGGALDINWHGSGRIALLRHRGEGWVALRHGFYGPLTEVDGDLAGNYSPESAEITSLWVTSAQGSLQAGVRLRDQRLHVEGLRLTAGRDENTATVSGSVSFPLDLRSPTQPETLMPPSGAIEASLALASVDLAKRFHAAKPGLAVRGTLQGKLQARGTLAEPELDAAIEARDLVSAAAEKLAPASGVSSVTYKSGHLCLSGSLAQPGLSPLTFKGSLPLDWRKALQDRRLDPATPIAGWVKLPPSSAGIFTPFLPGVRYLEGRLSVDASFRGTLGHPTYNGGAAFDLSAIRFQRAEVPGVDRFLGDLRFNGNEVTFQRFSGDIAGGSFSLTGKAKLEPLTNPQLDLRFQSKNTLLVRNDTLTLRSNSDLRLTGPLDAAVLGGKVGITKSRFFRQVEILPIGLRGRPAPKPATRDARFSTDVAPFRNWRYDVNIYTEEPFVVKGNLADGALKADLRLGGTGLAPTLDGSAWIDNLVASLPFSSLTVDHGSLYFSGNASLNPSLDIHGSSRIRDYNVNVYLYGTALEPQTLFTSEPSLPQEEVVTLLATGATTRDFQQNNQAATGRAAALLFQDIYHKVFPHRTALNSANPFDWFSLDVGGVDPRTGKQELMGKLKLTNAYQIGAGVDTEGDVRMQLQYLIRFR